MISHAKQIIRMPDGSKIVRTVYQKSAGIKVCTIRLGLNDRIHSHRGLVRVERVDGEMNEWFVAGEKYDHLYIPKSTIQK